MKTKFEKLLHFVIHHATSSVISNGCISSFSCISKHMGKKYHFLVFTFFHKPQVILGFLFLETILRHLCLSYIHPKLCVFFSIYIFFTFIKFGSPRATLLMIFEISDPLFFLHLSDLCFRDLLILFYFQILETCLLLIGTLWKEFS